MSPGGNLPLTAAQSEIWYDEQFTTGPLGYAMGDYVDLRGPLDPALLERALRRLSVEAEGLRVRFTEHDGVVGQSVAPPADGSLALVDLGAEPDPVAASEAWMLRDLDLPMKAAEPPLLRTALLRLGPEHHRLYLCMHHILSDGYSRNLVHPRLAAIYGHLAAGGDEAGLAPSAPPPFRLLLDAETAYRESPRLAKDRAYWTTRLTTGSPEPSSLSTREPAPGLVALRRTEVLDAADADRLRAAATGAGATPAVLVAAAMAAYVQRMTGLEEPLLTLPVTARVGAAARGVPGMVANYLPLAVPVRHGATRDELLRAAWVEIANALRHQRYRGERIRRDLGLRTDDRRPFGPFVNVLDQEPVLEFGPCRGQVVNLSTGIVNDLILTVLNTGDGSLELHLDGNSELYDGDELAAHAARFGAFLRAFASCPPDTVVDRLDVVLPGEPGGLLTGPAAGATREDTIALVRAAAARTPDAVAVVDGARRLTHAELQRRVEGVAARLRAAGCGPDTVVALLTRPGAGYLAAILACQTVGAAWLPLEVAAPAARTASLLGDAGVTVLLTGDGFDEQGREAAELAGAVPVLPLEPASDGRTAHGRAVPPVGSGQDLAYVMFTSGSTGRPKGAMVHRDGMLNHLRAKVDDLALRPGEGVVANAPLTFDVHVWQLLSPLLVGGCTVVADPETAADPDALFALAVDEDVAVLEVVPSLLRAALDLWDARGEAPRLPGLRRLMVTGEALPADLCSRWYARFPGIGMVNAYGPTECSDDVTHAFVTPQDAAAGRVPIGRPVRGTRLYVLGDGLRPMPVGVPGELWVGGVGVGRGYVGDPVRTASVFPADPFAGGGTRMYRTGDRVVLRPDGQLEFVERRDFQVKVRGRRVELGEIEAAVRAVPGVLDAVVVAHGSGLAGYVAAPSGVDAALLRDRVGAVLPAWMVPGWWVVLDALPLTANGKVDRKALPAPGGNVSAPSGPAVGDAMNATPADPAHGPHNGAEQTLGAVFAQVLGLPGVGADDDFFALGGDSIRAIEVVGAARRAGLVLSTRDVFTGRTARVLARIARPATGAGQDGGQVEPVGVLDLTPIAARLQEDTGSTTGPAAAFSQHIAVRVPAGLDADRLTAALQSLIDHHDALRTRLTEPAPGLWQTEVLPRGAVPADDGLVLTLPDERPPADRSALLRLIDRQAAAARSRLDPATARMVRAVLIPGPAAAPDEQVLLLVGHHLVVDGVSWRILLTDLSAACAALAEGRRPELQAVGTSFRAWSRLLTDRARTELRGAELAVWQRVLTGPDPLLGPRRLDPARDVRATAGTLRTELPPEVTGLLLSTVPAALRAEVNDVLLTALAVAVADWRLRRHGDGTSATLIELEGHGREEIADGLDLSRTVGWFTSIHPVRLDPGPRPHEALGRAVKLVKEQLREVPEHGIGHGLLRHLNPQAARLLSRYPRPQIGFNYMGRFDAREDVLWSPVTGDGIVGTGTQPAMPLEHVLALTPATEDRADGPHLVANWTFADGILDRESVGELADAWFRALRALAEYAASPDAGGATPADFPLVALDQEEIERYEAELAGSSPALTPGQALSDVLPLTPLQRGLLFHHEAEQDGVDVYTLQIAADLEGELDPAALRAAGRTLLRRHPALRAAFLHRASGDPVQLIPSDAELPWEEVDLTHLPESERAAETERLTDEERTRRFDLAAPPLLRFTLLRTGPQRYRFLWTSHHLLVDGWSMPILVEELLALLAEYSEGGEYSDGGEGGAGGAGATVTEKAELPGPAPHRRYHAWLAARDREAAREAWRRSLAELPGPTLVAPAADAAALSLPESLHLDLDPELTARLLATSRTAGLTVNTVVQGCWALLLGELTGSQDVVFGAITAGRPAEVPGIESMVGMFLTTVPVRVRLHPDATLGGLLRTLQDERAELLPHEHLGLAEIHRAAGLVGEAFDTVLLFENFPIGSGAASGGAGTDRVRVLRAEARDARHHPLSMAVLPDGDRLRLRLDYLPAAFRPERVAAVAERFTALLHLAATAPGTTLARTGSPLRPRAGAAAAPAPAAAPGGPAAAPRAPRTAREEALCAVFAQVLGVERVGANDDFFTLGGDSIRAIQVVSRAHLEGLVFAVRDVFAGRTVAALAEVAEAHRPAPPAAPEEPLLALDDDELALMENDLNEDML